MPAPIINDEQTTKSSIEQIYDAINDVLGGANPQQMLCLTIPGTVLDKESYVYDTRLEKPIKVAANESHLGNKLFDVTKVTSSDNGRQLSSQFVSAPDALTPKVNTKLMEAKDQIRKMLKMPVTYKLEDGTAIEGTLQEAFCYMYGEYVREKQIWADKQNEKKTELEDKYPGKSDEARLQREEEFLNWYQTVAETYLLQIQVKRGKILAFFSPNDMKILEGILSSGSDAELEEARELIDSKSSDYTVELRDSYLQLETISEEIEDVKSKLIMPLAKESENNPNVTMFSDAYEKRFQEILIHTDMSRAISSTSKISSSTISSHCVDFFWGGNKLESGSSNNIDTTALASSKMTIDIGFLATEVSIVHNWFNPGVFLLSKDMSRSSVTKISDGSKNADASENNLFPCYPTAFVIAKDVTIRFNSEATTDRSIKTTLESHAARGGGFLGFSGRKSTSSSDSKGITIKIPGSQIIGYYLQIVPTDSSTPIDTTNPRNMDDSILDFVNHYKEVYNNNL